MGLYLSISVSYSFSLSLSLSLSLSYQAVITTLPMMESSVPCSVPAHITGKYTNITNVNFPIFQLGNFPSNYMSRGKTETNVSQIFPIPPKLHVKAAKLKQIFPNIPNSVQLHVHAVKQKQMFPNISITPSNTCHNQ